jgi:predicted RND superfamily exporter protein
MMLFAVIFGLSMDYEVFLLSRIREDYDRSHDNASAVANGLAATARVITAAAAIMFCVFAAFVLGEDRSLKMFGLGLATAVLLDATVVRLVLVAAPLARPHPARRPRRAKRGHRRRAARARRARAHARGFGLRRPAPTTTSIDR